MAMCSHQDWYYEMQADMYPGILISYQRNGNKLSEKLCIFKLSFKLALPDYLCISWLYLSLCIGLLLTRAGSKHFQKP